MNSQEIDAFTRGLKRIMDAEGLKAAPLSEAAGLGTSAVRDLFRKGSSPKISTAIALARQIGRSVDDIVRIGTSETWEASQSLHRIAVAGDVGAGAEIYLSDAYEKGDGKYHVEAPPQIAGKHSVAVEVRGDSMEPVYSEGDIIFYVRPTHDGVPHESLNRKCVAEDDTGRVWVKQVKLGPEPGTFNLLSINPSGANMHAVKLRWAAPVLLHLPHEFVTKL